MYLQVHSFPIDYGRFYLSLDQFGDSGKNSQKIYTKTHKITFLMVLFLSPNQDC